MEERIQGKMYEDTKLTNHTVLQKVNKEILGHVR